VSQPRVSSSAAGSAAAPPKPSPPSAAEARANPPPTPAPATRVAEFEAAATKLPLELVMKCVRCCAEFAPVSHGVCRYKDSGEEPIKLSFLDFGGQEVFYTLHHLFITRFCVYVVTFNMEWLWEDASNKNFKPDECLSFLRFWLNSIYVHAQSPLGYTGRDVAPIILVGTRKDKIFSPADHSKISRLLYDKLHLNPAFEFVIKFKEGESHEGANRGLWFFPVSCKKREGKQDPVLHSLRMYIQNAVQAEEYMKLMVPIEWLRVMDRLQQMTDKFTSFSAVAGIATKCGLPSVPTLSPEEELLALLKHFTELGVLMHHPEASLRNLVILDPIAFLVEPATRILCNHEGQYHLPKQIEAAEETNSSAVRDLREHALLDPELLPAVWSDLNDDTRSSLQILMVKYGLMVPVLDDKGSSGRFIVPSLLCPQPFVSQHPQKTKDASKHCLVAFSLQHFMNQCREADFVSLVDVAKEGFMPKGLFSRVAGKIFSECQAVYGLSMANFKLTSNFCSASFGRQLFCLRSLESANVLELQVFGEHFSPLINRMTQLIKEAVNEMIPRLQFSVIIPSNGGDFDENVLDKHAVFYEGNHSLRQMLRDEGSNLLFVEPESALTFVSAKTRFRSWLPFDASDFSVPFDICISHLDSDSFSSTIATNLSRKLIGMTIPTYHQDKGSHTHGVPPDEAFAHVAAKCRIVAPVMCHAAVAALKKLDKDSGCNDAAGQFLVQLTLLYNLREIQSAHACRPVTFGRSTDDVVTSQFDMKCIDELPNVCVKSVIERVQKLLRYVFKRETEDLCNVTIRSVVQALLAGCNQTEHSLHPAPASSHVATPHDVAQFMKVSLNGLSASLRHLHTEWGHTAQKGERIEENGSMKSTIEELRGLIKQGNMKQEEYSQHIIAIHAEQRKKSIPCVLLLIPDQQSGTNVIEKVQNWMKSKVVDQLLLVMQCEMRVAKNRLHGPRAHGVLWHRPEPADPQAAPFGFKYSQPKESIRKLKTVLRHVTTVVKVCNRTRRAACPHIPHPVPSPQILGIAARVFGVDVAPLTSSMDRVNDFMGQQMLEFNNCVAGVVGEAAVPQIAAEVDGVAAQIQEFLGSPDTEALSQAILPQAIEGEALDQLLNAVEELRNFMVSNRQYCNGLHCHIVRRPTALLPDKVMWLCKEHQSLMQQWDGGEISEEELLLRVENPKAAAAASAAAPSSASPAMQPAPTSAPLHQPLVDSPASAPALFPSVVPPELKKMSAQAVASRIKSIAPAYEQYYQAFIDQGLNGVLVSTFAGRSHSDVLQDLETTLNVKIPPLQRVNIISELNKLFDHRTFLIQTPDSAQAPAASVRFTHSFTELIKCTALATASARLSCS